MALAREADSYSRLRGGGSDDRLAALRRLSNATIIVDRADEALSGHRDLIRDLGQPLREVRGELVAALDMLLRRERPPERLLSRIGAALAGLNGQSTQAAEDSGALHTRMAFVFGLAERRSSLRAPLDTIDRDTPGG